MKSPSIAIRTACAALLLPLLAALSSLDASAATRRAGRSDLFFGVGALDDDEAEIFSGFSLEAEQGNTVSLRWRLHFHDQFALETDLTYESGRVNMLDLGSEVDSADTDTTFFMINGVINLTRTPVSPFVSLGFGSYDHEASSILFPDGTGSFVLVDVQEDGGVLNAAVGVDGRTDGALVWLFEVRYLDYDFDDFSEDWGRILYTGHIGISF